MGRWGERSDRKEEINIIILIFTKDNTTKFYAHQSCIYVLKINRKIKDIMKYSCNLK